MGGAVTVVKTTPREELLQEGAVTWSWHTRRGIAAQGVAAFGGRWRSCGRYGSIWVILKTVYIRNEQNVTDLHRLF